MQLPSHWVQQCSPCMHLCCAQSSCTALPCTQLGASSHRGSSDHPGCRYGLIFEFQFPMLEADGESALQHQRQASQVKPEKQEEWVQKWVWTSKDRTSIPLEEAAATGGSAWDLWGGVAFVPCPKPALQEKRTAILSLPVGKHNLRAIWREMGKIIWVWAQGEIWLGNSLCASWDAEWHEGKKSWILSWFQWV